MSKNKYEDRPLNNNLNNASIETIAPVLSDLAPVIGYNLPLKEQARSSLVSKSFNTLFQPSFEVVKALTYVVEDSQDLLKELLNKDPSVLFKKHAKIQAPKAQNYYNVSPFLLITILCNKSMMKEVMSLDKVVDALKNDALLKEQYKNQCAEIVRSGASIIKLERECISSRRRV